MNILMTGGTGFVGSHLVQKLSEQGHHITVLSRRAALFNKVREPLGEAAKQVYYCDQWPLTLDHYDMIYNLAGVLGSDEVSHNEYAEAHIRIPKELTRRARCTLPVVHLSTAYVDSDTSHVSYVTTKRQSEKILKDYFGHVRIIRPGPIFGPGDKHHLPLYKMVKKLGMFCPIPGASNRFCPTHVLDVVESMLPINMEEGTFVLAGEPVTIDTFMKEVAKGLGKRTPFIRIPPIVKKDFFGVDRVFETSLQAHRDYPHIIEDAIQWYQKEQLI